MAPMQSVPERSAICEQPLPAEVAALIAQLYQGIERRDEAIRRKDCEIERERPAIPSVR